MADIFISYSKVDHALAVRLSTFLEAEGWSVWWDKSLGAADLYRDEIMKQLVAARAVITIWTENSVKSDWVRAEAGTAKKEGKLIPVKTPDVAYADIPLPFGEMHTENVEASQLIRAAVVAQLAKPAVEPSAGALLIKGFKYEVLTWVGIVGGALTLFTNLSAVLKVADWARVLVDHWKEWTHAFWVWAFGWLGIHLPPDWAPVLSFLLFGLLLAIGQAIQFRRTIKTSLLVDKSHDKSFQLISWRSAWSIVCMLTVAPVIQIGGIILIVSTWDIDLVSPATDREGTATGLLLGLNLLTILAVIVPLLSVAPAKAVSRRLIFLALGLLLLIALNEFSKLSLDVTAPKLQG